MNRAAILAAAIACSSAAAQEQITFKGLPLGASRAGFLEAVPDATCTGRVCIIQVAATCRQAAAGCRARYTYGGQEPIEIAGLFESDELASVRLTFRDRAHDELLSAIRERFGAPELEFDNRRQTRTIGWVRGDTGLFLTRGLTSADATTVLISSKGRTERSREHKAKTGAKDL